MTQLTIVYSALPGRSGQRRFGNPCAAIAEIPGCFCAVVWHRLRKFDDAKMARMSSSLVSYADLQQMPDDGRQYELYDGEVRVVPSPTNRHQFVLLNLVAVLMEYAQQHGGRLLFAPSDVVFTQYNVVQPDVLYFSEARRQLLELDAPTSAAPDLTVEVVSPGTSAHDRVRKQATYATLWRPGILDRRPLRGDHRDLRTRRHRLSGGADHGHRRRGGVARALRASRVRRADLRSQLSVRALPQASSTRTIRRPASRDIKTVEADICVLGAGISGVSAALEAAKLGRTVVIVDGAAALGGQAIGSIIGTIIGLYTHGPQPYQITHGIADDLIADLTNEGSIHRRVSMTGTITFQYDEVRLGRWIERKVDAAGIRAIVGAVLTGVAFGNRRVQPSSSRRGSDRSASRPTDSWMRQATRRSATSRASTSASRTHPCTAR